MSNTALESLAERLEALEAELARRDDRIATLEAKLEDRTQRLDRLETAVADLESRTDDHDERLEAHVDTLDAHTEDLERLEHQQTTTATKTEAALNKADANKRRLRELQARELEKGAHLRADHVDPTEIDVTGDHLERITTDDGPHYRVPDSDDPLDRTDTRLAHADLLPIQQLARLDEEMRRATTDAFPTRLAAALWEARTDPTHADDPWTEGCKTVQEYVSASDLKHWIRRQEQGISETYAKKLVSRTIDAILELSKNRLAVRKRTQRKNGLEYTERRLILPTDAEIPGETIGSDSRPPTDSTDDSDSRPPTDRTDDSDSSTPSEPAPDSRAMNSAGESDCASVTTKTDHEQERETERKRANSPETPDVLG